METDVIDDRVLWFCEGGIAKYSEGTCVIELCCKFRDSQHTMYLKTGKTDVVRLRAVSFTIRGLRLTSEYPYSRIVFLLTRTSPFEIHTSFSREIRVRLSMNSILPCSERGGLQ